MKQLVIGLGNPILGDDGVGFRVAAQVERRLPGRLRPFVDITEAAVGGLRLAEMMTGYDRVVLIDALVAGDEPGTLHEWSSADLAERTPPQHVICAHDTTLSTALDLHRTLGLHEPLEVRILAVDIDPVNTFSESLSSPVEAAVPRLADRVLDILASEAPIEMEAFA
jgi:hydrogenase maturation protease